MNKQFAPKVPSEALLYRSDTFDQDLASHFHQSNNDASRALVTTVINVADYDNKIASDNQFFLSSQAALQSSAITLTAGSRLITTPPKKISYVDLNHFNRMLKRREARNQRTRKPGCLPGKRKGHVNESRHERAKGRLRANGDRILSVTEATQPRTTPGKRAAEEDSVADLPVKKKGLECTGATCSSCCDKVSYKSWPEEPKGMEKDTGSTRINKGLTMSFYGAEELEELRKQYPI